MTHSSLDIDDGLLFNSVKMGYDWVSKGKRHTKVFYNEWSGASRECWKDTVVDGCRTFKINAAKSIISSRSLWRSWIPRSNGSRRA